MKISRGRYQFGGGVTDGRGLVKTAKGSLLIWLGCYRWPRVGKDSQRSKLLIWWGSYRRARVGEDSPAVAISLARVVETAEGR